MAVFPSSPLPQTFLLPDAGDEGGTTSAVPRATAASPRHHAPGLLAPVHRKRRHSHGVYRGREATGQQVKTTLEIMFGCGHTAKWRFRFRFVLEFLRIPPISGLWCLLQVVFFLLFSVCVSCGHGQFYTSSSFLECLGWTVKAR